MHRAEPRRLSPHFVCRVAGLPTTAVEALRVRETFDLAEDCLRLEDAIRGSIDRVSDMLFREIGEQDDVTRRRELLKLRRDLFNKRSLNDPGSDDQGFDDRIFTDRRLQADRLVDSLSPVSLAIIEDHLELGRRLRRQRERFDESFARGLVASRRRFQDAVVDQDFQRAIVISSPSLFRSQGRYLRSDPEHLRARDRQIERGLLKYWTRTVMKATPFGTFCAVIPGAIGAGPPHETTPAASFSGDPLRKRGLVRLNKGLCRVIVSTLRQDAVARDELLVRLNSTVLEEQRESLVFLVGQGRNESFRRIPDQRTLQSVRSLVAESDALSLGDLVDALGGMAPGTGERAIRDYLDRLIEIGFLWLSAGLPSQVVDWDERLVARWSNTHGQALLDATVALLREFGDLAERCVEAEATNLDRLLSTMDSRWDTYREAHGVSTTVKNLIFEDATADAKIEVRRTPGFEAVEATLLQYVEITSRLGLQRKDQIEMRHFFDSHYGEAVGQVPLLRFYENFFREHSKAHLEREHRAGFDLESHHPRYDSDGYDLANPLGLESIDRLLEARQELALLIGNGDDDLEEIDIDPSRLRHLVDGLEPSNLGGSSVALLGELEQVDGEIRRLVMRKGLYIPGFGKMFTRFLDLFPKSFQQTQLALNEALGSGSLAELCDDADYNANLHPPIVSREICYPNVESRGGLEKIHPSELSVVRDADRPGCLELRHVRTERRIEPIDTGFINPLVRPPLYKLLSAFTPAPSFQLPWGPRQLDDEVLTRVARFPRVTFGSRLVLRRRSWHIPPSLFPSARPKESRRDHFLRVARWRKSHGIPREVYARVLRRANQPGDSESHRSSMPLKRLLRAQKPQYVDFSSPLLVSLFARTTSPETSCHALIEERLPAEENLLRYASRAVVTEVVLQLDFPRSVRDVRS